MTEQSERTARPQVEDDDDVREPTREELARALGDDFEEDLP